MQTTNPEVIAGYLKIKREWSDCKKCEIGCLAKHHVLYSGAYQSDTLFVGEGPGRDEDYHGQAFVGPAGRLLRRALSVNGWDPSTFAYTNLVACRPSDSQEGPNRAPTRDEIFSCYGRLIQVSSLVKPKAVVLLGSIPAEWVPDTVVKGKEILYLKHPAYVLRNGGEKGKMFSEWSHTLNEFLVRVARHGR